MKLKQNWNETVLKQFWNCFVSAKTKRSGPHTNCFKNVSFPFCFRFISIVRTLLGDFGGGFGVQSRPTADKNKCYRGKTNRTSQYKSTDPRNTDTTQNAQKSRSPIPSPLTTLGRDTGASQFSSYRSRPRGAYNFCKLYIFICRRFRYVRRSATSQWRI